MTMPTASRSNNRPNAAPQARARLLEELEPPYELHVLNKKVSEQRQIAYRAVNPLGKVLTICNDEALVTKQVAIYIYLADLFPPTYSRRLT